MAKAFLYGQTGGRKATKVPEFTYTGQHELILDDDKNWRIKFKTSGTFTLLKPDTINIDVFLVGGGCSGENTFNTRRSTGYPGAGGCGGYTKTQKLVPIQKGSPYQIIIGAGGVTEICEGSGYKKPAVPGGNTSAFGFTVAGGEIEQGGSGGGGNYSGGKEEKDGFSDGQGNSYSRGQGFTTREFGEPDGELYSAGGGGGGGSTSNYRGGNGGVGGEYSSFGKGRSSGESGGNPHANIGGKGAIVFKPISADISGGGGYGGGGGGAGDGYTSSSQRLSYTKGGDGMQGIVVIRNNRSVKS